MTHPKPGEVLLTDPQREEQWVEAYDHVDAKEHYVICQNLEENQHGHMTVKEMHKLGWWRVLTVSHRFEYAEDGSRQFADPTEEE